MRQAILILAASAGVFLLLGLMRREPRAERGVRTIEFWTYAGGGSAGRSFHFWNEVARGFEAANPGVKVRTVTDINQGNYLQMLTTRFIAGNPPDVFIADDGMTVPLNQDGLLMPLDSFIEKDPAYRTDDFPVSMVRDGYVGQTRCTIPWYGGFGCLVYRTDLFAQAGVEPPRTWDNAEGRRKRRNR